MYFLNILFQASGNSGLPWWLWLLIILIIVALVAWLIFSNVSKDEDEVEVHESPPAPAEPVAPDDLTRIEGIGPKIASVFQDAGITTFASLAEVDVAKLQGILDAAEIRLGDPSTWPEQAKLAASGDWAALEKLQDELQGGRRD